MDKTVHVWDVVFDRYAPVNGHISPVRVLRGHEMAVDAVCCAPGAAGRFLCSASEDATLHVWDLARLGAVGNARTGAQVRKMQERLEKAVGNARIDLRQNRRAQLPARFAPELTAAEEEDSLELYKGTKCVAS